MIKKDKEKIAFSSKMDVSLANAIRRSSNLIPILAIDEVEIAKNDSALYDETLAHRIGLVPLKMPKGLKEDSLIKLKLSKKGQGYVYSGDFKGDAEVVFDKIPLTLLKDGQEVKLNCLAKVGKGKDHAKFSSGIITYREEMEITVPKKYKEKITENFENSIKEKSDKIVLKDNLDKPVLDFVEGLCDKDNEEFESKPTGNIIFTIESFGQISPEEIFKDSVSALKSELKGLKF